MRSGSLEEFAGYHSEWNLGSPGGWDYQRTSQEITKVAWRKMNALKPTGVELDLDHPYFMPVNRFVMMLVEAHREREGTNPGLVAVVAEEETLEDVTENINLAQRLSHMEGVTGALLAPHQLELRNGRVSFRGRPVSVIFVDFNSDVLMALHKKQGLAALVQAVKEGRVINPRGTEPINVKSMFEVLTGPRKNLFPQEIVRRTPWTRQFYQRSTHGPAGEEIRDLVEWTRKNWEGLVLKPARGYSGKGVRVGAVDADADDAISLALESGDYIVQKTVPLDLWAEEVADLDHEAKQVVLKRFQTDFRCFVARRGLIGFLGRIGGVPTNVGSGGGMHPFGLINSDLEAGEAARRINRAMLEIPYAELAAIEEEQKQMATDRKFTYLLGPIKIALRPRVLSRGHLKALEKYAKDMWKACLTLEELYLAGELDEFIKIDEDEMELARMQPWKGSRALIASDGLFNFGAQPRMNADKQR